MMPRIGAAMDIRFGATVEEFMRYVTDLGLDHVEFKREYLAGHPNTPSPDEVRDLSERYGVSLTYHAPFRDWNVGSYDETVRQNSVERVYDDVAALERLGAPLGVVSNNQHATIEFLLAHHELNYFNTAYGRRPTLAGAANRKPDPHYIDRALADLYTSDALYVGDSETDVLAAHNAGLDSVFLRREHSVDATLSAEPTAEMTDLRALVERLTGRH